MAEPDKRYTGDGQDNPGQAIQKGAEAAHKLSQQAAQSVGEGARAGAQAGAEAGKAAAQAGAQAATQAAAGAAVQGAVQTGSAVAGVAAGTAAGGPIGLIIAALWAMRHTLFKILVSCCLALLFFITLIISLPSIVANNVFQTDPDTVDAGLPSELHELADVMSEVVTGCVENGQDKAHAKVEKIIEDHDYDYDLSMEALINYAISPDYDVCFILSAYSASMENRGTTKADMKSKLDSVADQMFAVTYEEKSMERVVPATYTTYKAVTLTVITGKTSSGYTTASKTFYEPDGEKTSDIAVTDTAYTPVTVELPIYTGNKITGTRTATYYSPDGTTTHEPTTETVKYAECTIHPFDTSVIYKAFDIDPDAKYSQFDATYADAINTMAYALKMTLYGTVSGGDVPAITDAELLAILDGLDCSNQRKELVRCGLSLVGKVSYFWGGKSSAGWNDDWGTPRLVTSSGSSSSGTVRPYGMDCSGFTDWCYKTAGLGGLPAGSANQWAGSTEISASELLPGDLGFMARPSDPGINHVLMYVGRDNSGKMLWVHCSSSAGGVVLNSPSYVKYYRRMTGYDLENNNVVVGGGNTLPGNSGAVIETLSVEVTHYCNCAKCCGKWAGGPTASGKTPQAGMVAMSSVWPFGTLIEINGTLYTVEDRGGSGIENNRGRVDIYVNSHAEALRKGRFKTTAKIYRIGR